MEQLARLKARIASLAELRNLIRALRAMAASHVQEAQGALGGIRRYTEVVEDAIAGGAALLPAADGGAATAGPGGESVLIVVCSEHGFVGALNALLLERAEADLADGQQLVVIGRRGAALARERGLDVGRGFDMATHVGGVLGVTRQVADHLAGAATAAIVFASYRRGGRYEIAARRILPLDPALLARAPHSGPPLHHLGSTGLLQSLAGEYLFAEITQAVMESLASENGARLMLMDAADRNIADKVGGLQRRERTVRQEAITAELLDVVAGAEAVMERPE